MANAAKTRQNATDVPAFLNAVANARRRADALALCALMQQLAGEPPAMWGASIVGFGRYGYTYASGHSGESCRIGFAPRATGLVLYIMAGFAAQPELLARLGKHRTGKSCLYVNHLADIDPDVLGQLITHSLAWMKAKYP